MGVAGIGQLQRRRTAPIDVGGELQVGQQYNVATGVYNLSGGYLQVNASSPVIGPTTERFGRRATVSATRRTGQYRGSFIQTGADRSMSTNGIDLATLNGYSAEYDLSGPTATSTLSAGEHPRRRRRGTGDFFQHGGTNTITGDLTLSAALNAVGNYTLSSGILNAGSITMGAGDQQWALGSADTAQHGHLHAERRHCDRHRNPLDGARCGTALPLTPSAGAASRRGRRASDSSPSNRRRHFLCHPRRHRHVHSNRRVEHAPAR